MAARFRLVTLQEAKDHLGLLDTEDDARVDRLVLDASQKIMRYINTGTDDWTDTAGVPLVDANGDPQRVNAVGHIDSSGAFVLDLDTAGDVIDAGDSIIPGGVRLATLVLIGRLDDQREASDDPLSPAVVSLLSDYHDPVFS